MPYKIKTNYEQKIDRLIYRLGKIEDKLSKMDNGDFIIKEGSEEEKKLVSERLKIEDRINKLN